MILESVFNLFSSAIKLIFVWIDLPNLPPEVEPYIATLFDYIEGGTEFLYLLLIWTRLRKSETFASAYISCPTSTLAPVNSFPGPFTLSMVSTYQLQNRFYLSSFYL